LESDLKNIFKNRTLILTLAALLLPVSANGAQEEFSLLKRRSGKAVIHGGLIKRGSGCSACHSIAAGAAGLSDMEEWACLFCHSSLHDQEISSRQRLASRLSVKENLLLTFEITDILSEFKKLSVHPTLKISGVHRRGETLPEKAADAPRHAECIDCHQYHEVSRWNRLGPLKTTGAGGEEKFFKRLRDSGEDYEAPEYELCFNCHSDSYNLPVDHTNKRMEFDINNPSYHPVIGEGKSSAVPSLIKPYTERRQKAGDVSIIKCTDCHNPHDPKFEPLPPEPAPERPVAAPAAPDVPFVAIGGAIFALLLTAYAAFGRRD